MKIVMLGIDLGKNVCSLASLDETGAVVLRRRMKRASVLLFTAQQENRTWSGLACRFRLELELVDIELAGERNAVWRGAAPPEVNAEFFAGAAPLTMKLAPRSVWNTAANVGALTQSCAQANLGTRRGASGSPSAA